MIAVLFGLLTALSNAFAVAVQHIASTSETEGSSLWQLVRHLVRHPLWLLGWIGMGGSLVFQAVALHFGPLSVVQPLLVTELIMALALRRLWLRQSLRGVTWVSATLTAVGLVAFLVATSPSGGAFTVSTSRWTVPIVVSVATVVVLVALAQRGTPNRRAGLFAAATAIMWALEATFIKATTDTIGRFGWVGALEHWPIYALCLGGAIGLFCEQSALHVGPLSVSQPIIVIVDPIVSVLFGIWLYHEHLRSGVVHLGVGAVAFVVMSIGVVALTRTAPPSMSADVHRL